MRGTALVTGAAGFTGKYLVDALRASGYRVIALGVGEGNVGDEWVPCDLTDAAAIAAAVRPFTPDVVVHLAAISFVDHGHDEDFYRTNVIGTVNLLRALSEGPKPRKVLVASSANVYGPTSGDPITENACPAPVNHYAASKLAMEHLVRTWFDKMPIVITRPFNYTGPGQNESFLVPKMVAHFCQRKNAIRLGNIHVERDFTDVEDLVEAYMRLLESKASSEIVNICTGKTVRLLEIFEQLSEIAGYRMEVVVDPDFVRSTDVLRLVGSNEKLRALTGFAPSRPFPETLRRMYAAGWEG